MRRRTFLALSLALPFAAQGAPPPTVAVLYFKNTGNPELEMLKVGLAEMLAGDLDGTPGVEIVTRTELQAALDELELGHSGVVDVSTAARVGKVLQARWLLTGSYFELMGTLVINAKIIDVETTLQLGAAGREGPPARFRALSRELAQELARELTALAGTPTGAAAPTPSPAPVPVAAPGERSMEATLAWSEGLVALDRKDVVRARESFERALAADPDFELAKAQLAALE